MQVLPGWTVAVSSAVVGCGTSVLQAVTCLNLMNPMPQRIQSSSCARPWGAAKNDDQLRNSDLCGRFYCQSIFDGEELTYVGGWPECPRCGIDHVIGSASGLPIERRFLAAVKDFWLEPPFPDDDADAGKKPRSR